MSPPSAVYQSLLSSFASHPTPPIPQIVSSVPLLYYLCHHGHLDLLLKLSELDWMGKDPSERNGEGMALVGSTGLWAALSRGHLGCARLLLSDSRVTLSQAFDCETVPSPLIISSQDGHSLCVEFMCESIVGSGEPGDGGEVLDRVMGEGGETALFKAAQNGRLECCRILLQHGADAVKAAKSGLTPLAIAANSSLVSIVSLLLSSGGISLSSSDSSLRVVLLYAVRGMGVDMMRRIVEEVGVERAKGIIREGGGDFYVYLASSKRVKGKDAGELMLWLSEFVGEGGGRVVGEGWGEGDETPLMIAVGKGDIVLAGVILRLMEEGGVNRVRKGGDNALIMALKNRSKEIVEVILKEGKGVEGNATDGGGVTALHICAEWGWKEGCIMLLEKGADVHRKCGVHVHGKVRNVTARGLANCLDNECGKVLMEAGKREVEIKRGGEVPEWAKKYGVGGEDMLPPAPK